MYTYVYDAAANKFAAVNDVDTLLGAAEYVIDGEVIAPVCSDLPTIH